MSYPILYFSEETDFNNNGIGVLSDCISCLVTEVANDSYELEMVYPMDGIHFGYIENRSIVKAKPNKYAKPQLFRIYKKSKPISGKVTFNAQHISYDLSGIPVSPFYAEGIENAIAGFNQFSAISCPFYFWTDIESSASFTVSAPASIRSRLGGSSNSLLDVYGGEYEFDNYAVKLHSRRGSDRGFSIKYGKNLTDIKQDENCASVYTGIYPYWINNESGNVFCLREKIVKSSGDFGYEKILPVDFTANFEKEPTEEALRYAAENYISKNEIGVPVVSLTVSFSQLSESSDDLTDVCLFDLVKVEFLKLKIHSTAKIVKVVYDSLQDKIKNVTLGSVRSNIADTVANQQKEISNVPTQTDLQRVQTSATSWLTNGIGYKVERRDEYGVVIDTLYLDKPDVNSAVNIMKVGQDGISFSRDGVNGDFKTIIAIEGYLKSENESIKIDFFKNEMHTNVLNGKNISWRDNEDGTFSLVGT